jgi:hypothetical protein
MDTVLEIFFTVCFFAGTVATVIFIGMAIADDLKDHTK